MSRPAHLVCVGCGSCQDPTCPMPGPPCQCPNGVRWNARPLLAHDLAILGWTATTLVLAIHRAIHWPTVAVIVAHVAFIAWLVAR